MSDGLDWERQLMAAADALAPSQVDLAPLKQPLQAWLTELTQALAAHTIEVSEAGRTPPCVGRAGEPDQCAADQQRTRLAARMGGP